MVSEASVSDSIHRGKGVCMRGWGQIPPSESEKGAVRILLECFLVKNYFTS